MEIAKSQYRFAVLVVDDDITILDVYKTFFESNNIKVFVAQNSEEALRLVAQHDYIKIVITDLHMPESCVDGKTLALIIMEREPRTIVFAMTGYADKFLLDDCLRVGFRDYFVKPVPFDILLRSIKSSCERIKRWEKIK